MINRQGGYKVHQVCPVRSVEEVGEVEGCLSSLWFRIDSGVPRTGLNGNQCVWMLPKELFNSFCSIADPANFGRRPILIGDVNLMFPVADIHSDRYIVHGLILLFCSIATA